MSLIQDHQLPTAWDRRGVWRLWFVVFQFAFLAIISMGTYSGLSGSLSPALGFVTWFPSALKSLAIAALFTGPIVLADQGWRAAVNGFMLYRPPASAIVVNVVLFVTLAAWLAWTPPLREVAGSLQDVRTILFLISPIVWLAFGAASALVLFSPGAIATAVTQRSALVFVSLALAMFAYLYFGLPLGKSQTDALIRLTMSIAAPVYGLLGGSVTFLRTDTDGHPVFAADGFHVSIAPSCAGSQGMILATLIALLFVMLEHKRLRLHRVLFLVPLLACLMFLINAIRIAALLYIGANWSPEIAVNGFHSNFGVVSLAFVSILFVAVVQFVPAFRQIRPERHALDDSHQRLHVIRLLAPLVVLIGVSLLTGLFSGAFYWLYPVHVVAAAIALYWVRNTFVHEFNDISLFAIIVGVGTFSLWIVMIPHDEGKAEAFAGALYSAPVWLSAIWLACRFIGSVVVVPIAEELAFRGFLQDFLGKSFQSYVRPRIACAAAILVSAIAFGLAHSSVAAAFIAGIAYGLVYAYRGRLGDAIVAHGVTNFLIAIYVLMLARWSYW